jgi:glycosyltransferase involved in cell wall biosynthesis
MSNEEKRVPSTEYRVPSQDDSGFNSFLSPLANEVGASSVLKIGFLAADLTHKSGWAHYSLSLAQALQRAGVQITLIAARNSPSMDGIDVLPILPTVDPLEVGMLIKLARALPPVWSALRGCDLIHSAIELYAPLGALVAGRRPLIVTGHGSYVLTGQQRPFPVGALYNWAFRRGRMVCVSRYTARAAERAMPGIRTVVVNNGVDFERFGAIRHVGGGEVLSVGAVKARKGTLELARAMAQIPGASCTIVGSLTTEPEYAARVQGEIERLGLADRVILTGRIPDNELLRRYAEADVFVLPSLNVDWKFEGYGLSLVEASAAGLPVIGTTDCGAEDAVVDGVTGLLIPQANLESGLAYAIKQLLDNPVLRGHMGAAGRERARGQTWDHVAAQMIGLYKEALR